MASFDRAAHHAVVFPPNGLYSPAGSEDTLIGIEEHLGEAFHKRAAFHVNHDQPSGKMYVEHLQPLSRSQELPLILIHGDFQTGQIFLTKPDGNPGWASYFLHMGYEVYIPDLPHCGRSNNVLRDAQTRILPAEIIEREVTATAKSRILGWARAELHDKWPGTGLRGDTIFESFRASLTPMAATKTERETLAQEGLAALLRRSGRSLLIGVGSGAVAAWLAADIRPDLVAGVIAVEPSGPPCGVAHQVAANGHRTFSPFITFARGVRKYGVADIPLTYDPPLTGAVEVDLVPRADRLGACARQREHARDLNGERTVRRLVNLCKMPHVVVTSHTGCHVNYDWATVNFLKHAGLDVRWLKLQDLGILGNGHLMFLEVNSDEIAGRLHEAMGRMMPAAAGQPRAAEDGFECQFVYDAFADRFLASGEVLRLTPDEDVPPDDDGLLKMFLEDDDCEGWKMDLGVA